MGAETFTTRGSGKDITAAFKSAQKAAAYEHGHGGYTGTIAEKHAVVIIEATPTDSEQAVALAGKLIEDCDPRIDDKWGPAGAIRLEDKRGLQQWLFFGWASS